MAQKLSFACVEMILRYHLSPQQILFTHYWACHDTAVWFLVFVFVFCVGCFCLCFVCFVFGFGCFLCLGFLRPLARDRLIGLCIGPLPVAFCGLTVWPLRELIN